MRKLSLALTAGGLFVVALVASCSLDLDESLIDKANDGGFIEIDGQLPDGALAEGGGDGSLPSSAEAGACTSDEQCKTTDGCLKGKCDLPRKTCAFEVCRTTACTAGVCDLQKTPHTCGTGAPYKLKATQFPIGQALLCYRCIAAVHPWLFVATPTGAVAFNVSNVGSGSPPPVPITGLGFIPGELIQSGSRVWMRKAPSGPAGAPSRMELAYIDPPLDPFATKIVARTVLTGYSRPGPEGTGFLPRSPNDSAFLTTQNLAPAPPPPPAQPPAPIYGATIIDVGLLANEPASLSAQTFTTPANFGLFGVSGKRIVLNALANGQSSFALVDKPGEAGAAVSGATILTDLGGNASNSRNAGWSFDGAYFYVSGVNQGLGGPAPHTARVKGYFLLADDKATTFDANVGVDLETFNPPPSPDAIGPNATVLNITAMIDSKTAVVTTAAKDNPTTQTAVHFVKRDGQTASVAKRVVVNAAIDRFVAAASSDGIVYVVANDIDGPPVSGTVYVFDPACAP